VDLALFDAKARRTPKPLSRKETDLSSNRAPFVSRFVGKAASAVAFRHVCLGTLAMAALGATPVAAQNDPSVTSDAKSGTSVEAPADASAPVAEEEVEEEEPYRINLSVTVPRGDVNEAQAQECEDRADAGEISGEIIVCRRLGEKGENYFSGSRDAARKRYAQETAFKDDPGTPGLFGIPNHGNGIGIGGVPPPALIIDVGALPKAPPGSDADRIARGLPPMGQDKDLSEDEIRERREKLGLPPPTFPKKPD